MKKKRGRAARPKSISTLPKIELYQRESDPRSHAVRERLSELGLDFVAHNVPFGAPESIPSLHDRSKRVKLTNTSAILGYLEREYGKSEPNWVIRRVNFLDKLARANAREIVWRIRSPWERAQATANDTFETLRGTYRLLRQTFEKPSSK